MPAPGQDPPDEPAAADPPKGSFAGSLLVAHPSLRDPNFRRGVLLLTAHDPADGAMGLILNRPLAGKTAADLLPDHEQGELLGQVPVFLGGPIGRDQLSFAELRLHAEPDGGMFFRHHLTLGEAVALAEEDAGRLRAFVGYAGWAGGQLESEIGQSAWMLVKPQAKFFTPPGPAAAGEDRSWFRIMGSLGPIYKLLAAVPDDPSLN